MNASQIFLLFAVFLQLITEGNVWLLSCWTLHCVHLLFVFISCLCSSPVCVHLLFVFLSCLCSSPVCVHLLFVCLFSLALVKCPFLRFSPHRRQLPAVSENKDDEEHRGGIRNVSCSFFITTTRTQVGACVRLSSVIHPRLGRAMDTLWMIPNKYDLWLLYLYHDLEHDEQNAMK